MYLEGAAGYRAAIQAHWFTLISMIGNHGVAQDKAIDQAVEDTGGYVLLTRVGGQPTWIYARLPDRAKWAVSAKAQQGRTATAGPGELAAAQEAARARHRVLS
jgi:hypothetical protein